MALTVAEILTEIRVEVGDVNADLYSDDDLTNTYVPVGIHRMNAIWPQEYSIVSGAFTPDPLLDDNDDRRAIVLFCSLAILGAEVVQGARDGFYHSDVAGATDMRDRAKGLKDMRTGIEAELQSLSHERVQRQAEDSIEFKEPRRSEAAYGS